MKRLTAILLAMLMASFSFATTAMADDSSVVEDSSIEASVEDSSVEDSAVIEESSVVDSSVVEDSSVEAPTATNVAAGKSYDIVADDGDAKFNEVFNDDLGLGGYLTDGVVRDVTELTAAGVGNRKKTIEFAGTNRIHYVTINLGGSYDLSSVVLGTVRRGNNRYTNINSIQVKVGGSWKKVTYTETATVIEGSEQYGDTNKGITPYDQFFNVEAAFTASNVTAVKIGIDTEDKTGAISHYGTRGYIAQLDEIEVYGVPAAGGSGAGDSTSDTGDTGLGVFAILAVVSLAGVVVAKKVK